LDRLLEAYPLAEGTDLMETVHLQIAVKDFFKSILDPNSPNALVKFYIEKGEQKVEFKDWFVPDPPEEYNGIPVLQASQLNVEI
jgi:hypothetical protein